MSKPDQTGSAPARPVELEDWLNRSLYHPLAYRLARLLARTPVTPNAVSVASGGAVILAALLYTKGGGPIVAALGLIAHMAWHVLDGADGDLARLTGRASPLGEVVDGLCDYLSHLALYILLASVLAGEIGPIGWVLMISAGFARIAQTNFYETQRRQYQWWVYGKPWLRLAPVSGTSVLNVPARSYMWLSNAMATGGAEVDARLEAMTESEVSRWRPVIKTRLVPVIQSLSILSSNYRTLVIGAAMIAGMPIVIVLFELVLLMLLLPFFAGRTRRAIADILVQSEASSER